MKALIQRTKKATVKIDEQQYSEINQGLLIFLGVEKNDSEIEIEKICKKIQNLRIFPDENDKMNYSVCDISGEILVVSQFTLAADCKKGNRPNFTNAELPERAEKLYNDFITKLQSAGLTVKTGKFGAMMDIELINWGPVTFLLEYNK